MADGLLKPLRCLGILCVALFATTEKAREIGVAGGSLQQEVQVFSGIAEPLQLDSNIHQPAADVLTLGLAYEHLLEDQENTHACLGRGRQLVEQQAIPGQGIGVARHKVKVTGKSLRSLFELSLCLRPVRVGEQAGRVSLEL